MYILNVEDFSNFNCENVLDFIQFWNNFYEDHERADEYIRNLNIGQFLTEDNVRWLIEWKQPRPNNQQVNQALNNINILNQFRNGILGEDDFREHVAQIYQNGYIISVFLFHICQPTQYTIWDKYVLQTFRCHSQVQVPDNRNIGTVWEYYQQFRRYFSQLVQGCGYANHNNDIELYVRNLKNIDNALWAFGKFLKKYGA